jgi:hypothetical protein
MRMARKRSQNERIFLTLPPLENMHAVQSALSQLVEAVAADMIDLKRAQFLLTALRHAASNFKNPKAWQPSAYVNDPEAPSLNEYPDFEAEYGLPNDLNLASPPEVAFPPPPEPTNEVILSGGGLAAAVEGPAGRFVIPSVVEGSAGRFVIPSAATAGSVVEGPAFPPAPLPTFLETTPADIELEEIMKKYGYKAWDTRANEHQRNERRRKLRQNFRANYARYEAEAKARNIQRAAEQLFREKLAAEKSAATVSQSEGFPVQEREADLGGSLPAPDGDSKKPPAVAAGAQNSPTKGVSKTA